MISDENIATAQIAQIFGSELLKAQQSARTDSGSTPDFLKIHPAQFLTQSDPRASMRNKQREQMLLQQIQREAEMAYPITETSTNHQPSVTQSSPALPTHTTQIPNHNSSTLPVAVGRVTPSIASINSSDTNALERIADNLERIANSLQNVDVVLKKKKVRRNKTSNGSAS